MSGERELAFYPGTCRGSAFGGFVYESEVGTRAAELRVSKGALGAGGALPEVFRCYFNGGGVFFGVEREEELGVEVLARFTEDLDVEGEGDAAVVYRRVGEGHVVLTGPHPEYATENLDRAARNMNPEVFDALAADDRHRDDFVKAFLIKLGLEINTNLSENPPALSPIHLTSSEPGAVSKILSSLEKAIELINGEQYIKAETDIFRLAQPDSEATSTWSMSSLSRAVLDALKPTSPTRRPSAEYSTENESTHITTLLHYSSSLPSPKSTPYFNHAAYFTSLAPTAPQAAPQFGTTLLYTHCITSTSTVLEKNPLLTAALPPGTILTATTQLSGRGRGNNIWVSPPGSLMFSFTLTHPLALNARAPVVFLQYIAAVAVAEAVTGYERKQYKDIPIRLKWPNDIYSASSGSGGGGAKEEFVKIGGILVHTSYAGGDYHAVVGIGLNVSNPAPTTSLNALVQRLNAAGKTRLEPYTPERLLARIMSSFGRLYARFKTVGFTGEVEGLYQRYWLHGGQVVTLEEEGGVKARVKGVTRDWGLLLAEEVVESGFGGEKDGYRGTGKMFALQSDSNSFDFMKGLVKRKL